MRSEYNRFNNFALAQGAKDDRCEFVGGMIARPHSNFRIVRYFIRRVDAGKVLELSRLCLCIQTFVIALHTIFERRVDEHFNKLAFVNKPANDRVYVSTITGVQVFDAKGQYLGTIALGRQPANVAFSGADKQTLYITAREGLYRVKMLSKGPARLGK